MNLVTAQKILSDWAAERGFSTTTTAEGRLYFHRGSRIGFAFIDFKIPKMKLIISNTGDFGAHAASWYLVVPQDVYPRPKKKDFDEYDLSLTDSKVFDKIGRILERTLESYEGL